MSQLTREQHEAFTRACEVVDRIRANDIRRLKHWEHGMCGCLNALKPEVPQVTPEEDSVIRALWETLPGHTCWMNALSMLCSQPAKENIR